jgi:iron complex outermembrane receptor protein
VGGNFKGFTINAGIDNVFDKKYFEHLSYLRDPFATGVKVPEPGRTFYCKCVLHLLNKFVGEGRAGFI